MSKLTPQPGGQDQADQSSGLTILSVLLAGLLFYGGLGWLADKFFETRFLIVVGFMLGFVLSLFLIVKNYGSGE